MISAMKLAVLALLAASYLSAVVGARSLHSQQHEPQGQLLRLPDDAGHEDELMLFAQQWLNTKDELTRAALINANSDVVDMKYYLHGNTFDELVMTFTYKAPQNGRYYTYRCGTDEAVVSSWHCKAVNWPWVHSEDCSVYNYKPVQLLPVKETAAEME